MHEEKSVCRYCPGACGVLVEIGENGSLLKLRGDRSHVMSKGYVCVKGIQAAEAANGPLRLLHPLKRMADGSFREIALETALDEIARQLREIIDASGSRAIGLFKGTQSYFNIVLSQMLPDWMQAIRSPSYFTTLTVDQSAKAITMCRMGYWDAGRQRMDDSDVMMLVGTNPLLSISTAGFVMFNATKQMKMSKARGMKLIVVDPRRTETAEYADVFLQPQPGEDATVFAGLIRIILKESWHDTQFCDRYVSGIAQLSAAVEPFTPSYVQSRAGLSPELMRRAAEVFARDGRRGIATTGTGTTMAPHSNLADHLVECLNVVCGRMLREGERVANPGVSTPYRPFRAQVVPPNRTWDIGHHGNTGFGTLNGEMMSATLADEILTPGDGRIRALVIAGANPAVCLPNQRHAVKALRALDLLVAIEPYMTASAKLCHYILPPKLQYERTDVTFGPMLEQILNPLPFQQYIPAICTAPAGSEVCDDWYVFWSLAKRLGMPLEFAGQRLEFDVVPTTDELLTIMLRGSRVPFEEIAKYPEGRIFDVSDQFVEPGQPNQNTRFEIAPHDVIEEIASVAAERLGNDGYAYRLAVRRMRDVSNSLGQNFAASLRRGAYNPAFIHPEDLQALNLESGDAIQIQSAFGCISAIAESDDTLRPGVVSISHCWGGLPGERSDEQKGSSTNLLITTESRVESINAMAWMTAVPINVRRLSEVSV